MGWWIALGIIVLLAVLPLGVSVKYDEAGPLIRLIAGPLKITLFPRPKKEKKPNKEKKKEEKKPEPSVQPEKKPEPQQEVKPLWEPAAEKTEPAKQESPKPVPAQEEKPLPAPEASAREKPEEEPSEKKAEPEKKKSGGPITDFLPLLNTVLDMLNAFRRKLRVDVLEVKVILGGDDPAELGINYGRAWTAIGNFQPYLERFLVIKKRKIEVECDFCASQTLITARLDLTITLGRIIGTVVFYGVKALFQFLKINKKRKGGAAK